MSGALVLDSEGLANAVQRDREGLSRCTGRPGVTPRQLRIT
ncbi:hypothetical protein AB0896_17005 [Streptomyces parvulus]